MVFPHRVMGGPSEYTMALRDPGSPSSTGPNNAAHWIGKFKISLIKWVHYNKKYWKELSDYLQSNFFSFQFLPKKYDSKFCKAKFKFSFIVESSLKTQFHILKGCNFLKLKFVDLRNLLLFEVSSRVKI